MMPMMVPIAIGRAILAVIMPGMRVTTMIFHVRLLRLLGGQAAPSR
jgi:hypothetical protein